MINYNSASGLRAFLDAEGLGMQKKFGQNFLINPAVRQALADALECEEGSEVWEIGPGLGAMTSLLLEKNINVKAFEIDAGFIRILKKMFDGNKNFTLVEGDCLETWNGQWNSALNNEKYLLGNLPYNIAAVLLADFIEKGAVFKRMMVTVQKEVALRMIAKPGSKDYSSFSVLCASSYNIKPVLKISPASFYPKPNVDSMGVLLEPKPKTEPYPKMFYSLVRALFASRRKTIKNNLAAFIKNKNSSAFSAFPRLCERVFSDNNLTGNERAETLELEQFVSIAKTIENVRE